MCGILNMDGLENSCEGGGGSRGHANIGQASLNFDCTRKRAAAERKKGRKKKFRFMNEIRQKNCRPLAQNDPPLCPGLKLRVLGRIPMRYFGRGEDDLRRPSTTHCRYLAFFVIHLFQQRRDISPINIRYGHISKLILKAERFPVFPFGKPPLLYSSVESILQRWSKRLVPF